MKYELTTPLLFANILRWMAPDTFRSWELTAGTVGTVDVELESETDPSSVHVITEDGKPVPFTVQGHSLSEKEATAHLVFSVNDQTTVVDFPVNSKSSFVQQLKYKAWNAADARITVFLLADRDSRSDSGVQVNVASIDADLGQQKT